MNERNTKIKELLRTGKVPAFRYEIAHLQGQLEKHAAKQSDSSRQLWEAMHQSSETWHDNAPAEAIVFDSWSLASMAETTISSLRRIVEFDMVDSSDEVTLGSIFTVEYALGEEVTLLLVGIVTEIPETFQDSLPENCTAIALSSPLGSAVLGARKGDIVSFDVGDRHIKVKIVDFGMYDQKTVRA